MDARGISRGRCKNCSLNCSCYTQPPDGLKCSQCGCPPARHIRSQQGGISDNHDLGQAVPSINGSLVINQHAQVLPHLSGVTLCAAPNCGVQVGFDINTGMEYTFCPVHANMDVGSTMTVEDIEDDPFVYGYHPDQGLGTPYHHQGT